VSSLANECIRKSRSWFPRNSAMKPKTSTDLRASMALVIVLWYAWLGARGGAVWHTKVAGFLNKACHPLGPAAPCPAAWYGKRGDGAYVAEDWTGGLLV
jgi:hypothetical protein